MTFCIVLIIVAIFYFSNLVGHSYRTVVRVLLVGGCLLLHADIRAFVGAFGVVFLCGSVLGLLFGSMFAFRNFRDLISTAFRDIVDDLAPDYHAEIRAIFIFSVISGYVAAIAAGRNDDIGPGGIVFCTALSGGIGIISGVRASIRIVKHKDIAFSRPKLGFRSTQSAPFSSVQVKPPALAHYLLGILASGEWAEGVLGDFLETFERNGKHDLRKARRDYWRQLLRSVPGLLSVRFREAVPFTIFAEVVNILRKYF